MEQLQQEIKSWIQDSDRDYFDGIKLLTKISSNRMLIRNLSRSSNHYFQEKLLSELKKASFSPTALSRSRESIVEPAAGAGGLTEAVKNSEVVIASPPSYSTSEELGLAVEKLEISLSQMHNKKGILSNTLRDFPETDNEGRKNVIDQITSLNKAMASINEKLIYFKRNGVLPPIVQRVVVPVISEKDIPESKMEMKQLLLNERSALSKLKRKLADPKTKKDKISDLQARVDSKSNLINEVERRLNGTGN